MKPTSFSLTFISLPFSMISLLAALLVASGLFKFLCPIFSAYPRKYHCTEIPFSREFDALIWGGEFYPTAVACDCWICFRPSSARPLRAFIPIMIMFTFLRTLKCLESTPSTCSSGSSNPANIPAMRHSLSSSMVDLVPYQQHLRLAHALLPQTKIL